MVYAPQTQSGNFFNRQERDVRSLQVVEALTFSKERVAGRARLQGRRRPPALALRRRGLQPAASTSSASTARWPSARMFPTATAQPQVSGTEFAVFVQDRWRLNDRLMLELGVRSDRDEVVETVNYSPRGGAGAQPAARRARHPARRDRQVRRAHAAHRRRVHAVSGAADGARASPPTGAPLGAPVTFVHTVARRPLRTPREHRADGGLGSARRPALLLQGGLPQSQAARTPTSSTPIRPLGLLTLGLHRHLELLGVRDHRTVPGQRAPRPQRVVRAIAQHPRPQRLRPVLRQLPQPDHPAQRELAQHHRRAEPADRPRFARAAGSVGVHADLRMADAGFRGRRSTNTRTSSARGTGRDGCPRSRPSTSRWLGRGGSGSTASPPASRSTTPSTRAASATCRPTSRPPTTAASTTRSSARSAFWSAPAARSVRGQTPMLAPVWVRPFSGPALNGVRPRYIPGGRGRGTSSRRSTSLAVECLHHGEGFRRTPARSAPGHARHADPADAAMGPAARARHRPGHPGAIGRPAEGRDRIPLPGTAPAREARPG